MTVLFALVPSFVAIAIFVGTYRFQPTRPQPRVPVRAAQLARTGASPLRSPLPLGAVRRQSRIPQELRA